MIVTHSGRFHADEVFATAMILMIEDHEIIRTRDQAIIETGDIVLDVGGEYDHSARRYDHHQNAFTETRENGIPFATAGIVWKHYGESILNKFGLTEKEDVQFALEWVDRKILEDLDALDNGLYMESNRPSVSMLVGMRNGDSSDEEEVQMQNFMGAVEFASDIFERFVKAAVKQAEAQKAFLLYAKDVGNGVIELEQPVSYKDIIKNKPEIHRVVYPRGEDQYGIYCNGKEHHLPEKYRGLRDEELQQVTGREDAVFCHKTGFMAVFLTRESALQIAKT